MQIKSKSLPGVYTDSMSLMALSTKVNQLPGVEKAMIGMGTDMNKQVINDVGLMTSELEAATRRAQRERLFTQSAPSSRVHLDRVQDGDIVLAWQRLRRLTLGLNQEGFPR